MQVPEEGRSAPPGRRGPCSSGTRSCRSHQDAPGRAPEERWSPGAATCFLPAVDGDDRPRGVRAAEREKKFLAPPDGRRRCNAEGHGDTEEAPRPGAAAQAERSVASEERPPGSSWAPGRALGLQRMAVRRKEAGEPQNATCCSRLEMAWLHMPFPEKAGKPGQTFPGLWSQPLPPHVPLRSPACVLCCPTMCWPSWGLRSLTHTCSCTPEGCESLETEGSRWETKPYTQACEVPALIPGTVCDETPAPSDAADDRDWQRPQRLLIN